VLAALVREGLRVTPSLTSKAISAGVSPTGTEAQPVVALLDLPAVADLLLEYPELVADAVPIVGISRVAIESM